MATGTFTYNALRAKTLKERIKTQKNCQSFRLDKSNAVGVRTTAVKPYLSIPSVGLVWFARYCGKMYNRHLFPYGGLANWFISLPVWILSQSTYIVFVSSFVSVGLENQPGEWSINFVIFIYFYISWRQAWGYCASRADSVAVFSSSSLFQTNQSSFIFTFTCRNFTHQVARSVAAASSISFNQPSPAAIAVYSHVRHQPSQNAEAQSTSILNRAKHEILRIIDLMVEKTQQEVVDLLTDVCTTMPDTCNKSPSVLFKNLSLVTYLWLLSCQCLMIAVANDRGIYLVSHTLGTDHYFHLGGVCWAIFWGMTVLSRMAFRCGQK